MQLRSYQLQLIMNIRSILKKGNKSVVAVLGCGGGKSIIQGVIAKNATSKGNRVLFLVHRKELCEQIKHTFFDLIGVDSELCDVSMVQTASRRLQKLPEYRLIITDECFTSDTLIDNKLLTNLQTGDIISSYNSKKNKIEQKRITRIFKKKPSSLMGIKFSDGTFLKCTFNHPIYVEGKGYIPAIELKEGYYVRKILLYNVWKEKRILFEHTRVESVEIYKQTSDGTFGGMCPDGYVYNLEVNGNHNYFANGILVHNCHHSTAKTYTKIYDNYPNAIRLGFTATPIRLNKGGLGDVYSDLVTSVSTKWLIDNQYLAPYKYYSVKLADTSSLHTVAGEYNQNEVAQLMQDKEIYGDTVKQWERLAKGKKTIVYCASVEAADKTAQKFLSAGYAAVSLDGTTSKQTRKQIIDSFREGSYKILCNCELFGEGLDIPDCECVVLLRPTQSLSLFIQQSMRSMRYIPGKTAIIIDHVGNCYKHGLPDDEREWTLEPKHKQETTVKIRECRQCYAVYPPSLNVCPYCGYRATHEIVTQNKKMVDIDLVELQRKNSIKNTRLADADLHTWGEVVEFQELHGYKFAWCLRYCSKCGIKIPKKYSYMMKKIGL